MGIKKILSFGKEELELVVVEAEDEEKGNVVASFKTKTDRNSLTDLARYIKDLMYDENDPLKVGSYTLNDMRGKVVRRIQPKKERTADDLSKMKQDEALALLKHKRDESIASISELKEMQKTFQNEFGLAGAGDSGEEVEVPDDVKTIWDAMKQAYAKRAYIDIMAEPGSVGKTVNNMASMAIGIGTAVGEYLTAKSKEISKKTVDERKKELTEKKKEIKKEEVIKDLTKEPEEKVPALTAEVIEEGERVLRKFKELEVEGAENVEDGDLLVLNVNGTAPTDYGIDNTLPKADKEKAEEDKEENEE